MRRLPTLELERLSHVLHEDPTLRLAIVFGSLGRGEAGFASDVDVAVLDERPLGRERREDLIARLAEALGRPVDLIDLQRAGVVLLREVLQGGRTLLCRDPAARQRLVVQMLTDTEDFLPLVERMWRERRERWIG